MRLSARKELKITDEYDEVLKGEKSLEDVSSPPKARSSSEETASELVDRKLEEQGFIEDNYVVEHQLKLTHKLILRGATTKEISKVVGVSLSEASDLRKTLKVRLADNLKHADPMELVSEGTAFYDEVIAEAMKLLDKAKPTNKVNDMVRILEVAIRARSEKDKFLVNTGILNNNQQSENVVVDVYAEQAMEVRHMLSDIMEDPNV
jgi:hypothetical protein